MTDLQEHLCAYLLQITDTPVHREPVDDCALIARLRAQYEDAVEKQATETATWGGVERYARIITGWAPSIADAVAGDSTLDYDTDGH